MVPPHAAARMLQGTFNASVSLGTGPSKATDSIAVGQHYRNKKAHFRTAPPGLGLSQCFTHSGSFRPHNTREAGGVIIPQRTKLRLETQSLWLQGAQPAGRRDTWTQLVWLQMP